MKVGYAFYDEDDGELIWDIQLGTYEVITTTVTVHSSTKTGSGPRTPDNITINYVIRRDK